MRRSFPGGCFQPRMHIRDEEKVGAKWRCGHEFISDDAIDHLGSV